MNSKFINEISSKIFDIYECKTNAEILAYFQLIRQYGLVELKYLDNISQINQAKNNLLFYSVLPITSFICWYAFQKKFFLHISWMGLGCIYFLYRKKNKLYKSEIDELYSLYKARIEKFKKDRSFLSLNPEFINEKINIPEMNLIQYSYKS
jgi:hypothetical protein